MCIRDRYQVGQAGSERMCEDLFGHGQASILQRIATDGRGNDRHPERGHGLAPRRKAIPKATAMTPPRMVGTPAVVKGISPKAAAAATSATRRALHEWSRGHRRPRKAAPTAASRP